MQSAWGWDESMHAQLPALRLLEAWQRGAWTQSLHALNECEQYPFAWPVVLALVQVVSGVSEYACRVSGRVVWGLGLFAVFLVARTLAARIWAASPQRQERLALAPWVALALAALSPLAVCYSGTLFLEVPFTVVSACALLAWIARAKHPSLAKELVAGALLALAFFTKFNYGLLLGAGLFGALVLEALAAVRAREAKAFLIRTLALGALPLALFSWWFLWPWPGDGSTGASHRAAFLSFLSGNRDPSMATPPAVRVVHWSTFLVWSPRVLVLALLGALVSLKLLREPGMRALWLVFLAFLLPVSMHPFHLDRFLIPVSLPLWILAALGCVSCLPARALTRRATGAGALALVVLLVAPLPGVDSWWVLRAVGAANPKLADYQRGVLAEYRDLRPARALFTNGLKRPAYDALLDLYAAELGPTERVGWLGNTNTFSPAALHAGLWMRGHPIGRARFARANFGGDLIAEGNDDPNWTPAQLFAWAKGYSVLLATDPLDMTQNPGRAWLARYGEWMRGQADWTRRELGHVEVPKAGREPLGVLVLAYRPNGPP